MRVKHKDSEKGVGVTSMALCNWHEHYLPNKKYLNYEFYDVPEIFDLFEINENTGKADIYIKTDFKGILAHLVRENPKKYVLKDVDPNRLDEYLMPRNIGVQSSLELKKTFSNKPHTNKTSAKIYNPFNKKLTIKFWKLISENKLISSIVLAIILYFVKSIFNIEL